MAPGVTGHDLGTAGPSGSNEKPCASLVIQVVTSFVGQEELGSIRLSPHNTQQPTQEVRFYMDALPSQTASTLIKLVMKTPQHQAKYCQEKFTQISLTLNKMPMLNLLTANFGNAHIKMSFAKSKPVSVQF